MDRQLAPDRGTRVGSRVQCGTDAFGLMPVECSQELLIGSGHGERLMHYNAERPRSPAGAAGETLNPGKPQCGPGPVQRLVRPAFLTSEAVAPHSRSYTVTGTSCSQRVFEIIASI